MPVTIEQGLKEAYLDYFRDEDRFKIPFRDPGDYNVADHFFDNLLHARESLVYLLRGLGGFPEPEISLREPVYAEFTVTGHAEVREIPGQEPGVKILVGQSPAPLREGKKGTGKAAAQHKYADPGSLVITSHLTRAIQHAVLKYDPSSGPELATLADSIEGEMRQNKGAINRNTLVSVVELALDNGIIPTMLLGSHYYGMRDLHPEKPDQFDIDAFSHTPLCKSIYEGVDEDGIMRRLGHLKSLAEHGRDPFQMVEDESGRTLTENMLLYAHRVAYLLRLFSPNGEFYEAIKGKKINLVGHSSNIDVILAYFRHFGDLRLVIAKAPKSQTRYKETTIKVGQSADDRGNLRFDYLNDPASLDATIQATEEAIGKFRQTSADPTIRSGEGIMPTGFYGLRKDKNQQNDERFKVGLDNILRDDQPYLVLANPGLGKTMFSLDLAIRLMPSFKGQEPGELNPDNEYIPILARLRELTSKAKDLRELSDHEAYKQILTGGIAALSEDQIAAYKQDGKRFVFILDGYDELNPIAKDQVTWQDLLKDISQIGKVIMTSRKEGFSEYEDGNSSLGYGKTTHIDSEAIIEHLPEYLRLRAGEDAPKLEEFIKRQAPDIRKSWLMVYFITTIYDRDRDKIDLQGQIDEAEVRKEGLEWYIFDHAATKDDEKIYEPVPRHKDESDKAYKARNAEHRGECKEKYIAENKPLLMELETCRMASGKDMLTPEDVNFITKLHEKGISWLVYKNEQRTKARQHEER